MKKLLTFFIAGAAIAVLGGASTACNDINDPESGLGKVIRGMEVNQATGTIIGKYEVHGFGAFLVQVDEGFPIGETYEFLSPDRYITLPEFGTYDNMIQVQHKLPLEIGNRISFSFREYKEDVDFGSLFIRNSGSTTADNFPPQVPIFVITEYKIENN